MPAKIDVFMAKSTARTLGRHHAMGGFWSATYEMRAAPSFEIAGTFNWRTAGWSLPLAIKLPRKRQAD
jgi:hypothetical protein